MSKQTFICVNTVVGYDDLEGRYTKRPGEPVSLDPTDKGTIRLLQLNAIRPDGGPVVEAPAVVKSSIPHVDTSGDDGLGDADGGTPPAGDVDDGLGDDVSTKNDAPPAAKPLTAAQQKAATKAAAAANKK